jgi:hypothetical protein
MQLWVGTNPRPSPPFSVAQPVNCFFQVCLVANLATEFSYQLAQLAKFLCEVELNWRIFFNGGGWLWWQVAFFIFATVCKLSTIIIFVI